jgi:single-strand DNA-binding protein
MPQPSAGPAPRNEVVSVGRLGGTVDTRVLASGDEVTSFRLIVGRVAPRRSARPAPPRAPVVDTVDCAVWTARLRKTVCGWEPGDVVEVHGGLRRRFWRAAGGPASRYEVEVLTARRVRRAR